MTRLRYLVPCTLALLAVLAPRPALPCGPGLHVREAGRLLEMVAEDEPEWLEWLAVDYGTAYLRLGSISPDFSNVLDSIPFGHGTALSFHLLDRAEELEPRFKLFALGHLAHNTSDAFCEMFQTPTVFGAAPIGVIDLITDGDDAQGESEGIVESLGDLILGDWDGVVDALYDLWMEDDAAKARMEEMILWFCEEGATFKGLSVDCPAVYVELEELLLMADEYLGGYDREGAKALAQMLLGGTPAQLADLTMNGLMTVLAGEMNAEQQPWYDEEYARVKQSAIVEGWLWEGLYEDHFEGLGATFGRDRYFARVSGWPSWEPKAMICGNVQSVMRFMPDTYDVVTGLHIDGLWFERPDGTRVTSIGLEDEGAELVAVARVFSTIALAGTVRGVVRKDRPGLDTASDEVVGEAEMAVDIDPFAYVSTPRDELAIPFTVDSDGALGFYVELYLDDAPGPWMTTSWDRLWTAPDVPLDRPAYQRHFGTYGHWPPSLPLAAAEETAGALFVTARVAPGGPGIEGAEITVDDEPVGTTAANGTLAVDARAPGPWTASAAAVGYASAEPVAGELTALEYAWATIYLHAVPEPALAPEWVGADGCLTVTWDPAPFGGQAASFLAQPFVDAGDGETGDALAEEGSLGLTGTRELCLETLPADGAAITARMRARYADGTLGIESWAAPVHFDGSAPEILTVDPVAGDDNPDCVENVPYWPALRVSVSVETSHAPLASLEWRLGEGDWQVVELADAVAEDGLTTTSLDVEPVGDDQLFVRARNAAGGETISEGVAPLVWGEERLCPEPVEPDAGADVAGGADAAGGDDIAEDDVVPGTDTAAEVGGQTGDVAADEDVAGPDTGADVDGGSSSGGSSGGCTAGGGAGHGASGALPLLLTFLFAHLLVRSLRRRSLSARQ